jgi:uncharacterized membrane protein
MAQPRTVLDNIQAIIDVEEQQERGRSFSDRLADAIATFAGTVIFVLVHLAWFALWAVINLGVVKLAPAFDPYPFQLLCMLVSLEGVLLSTFVLIKQNRMSNRADRRAHLDLQVNLLTEKEVTKVIQLLERISAHLGMADHGDAETRELGKETAVDELARELQQQLPENA